MKKISNWSILGYIFGAALSIGSFIRYYIIFPDLDRALIDVIIGMIICGLAWLYNKHLEQQHEIEAIEDYLDDHRPK